MLLALTAALLCCTLWLHLSSRWTFGGAYRGRYACNAPLRSMMVGSDAWEEIRQTRKKAGVQHMPEMTVGGYGAAYDSRTRTFFVSLDEGTDPGAFDPQVTLEMPETISVSVCFLEEKLTASDLAADTGYRFMIYNDDYWVECGLKLTTLPVLRIATGETPEDPDDPIGMQDVWAELSLYDNRAEADVRVTKSGALLHKRGTLSLNFPQNSYRVSLRSESTGGSLRGNDLSLLGMRADDDWILASTYSDPDKIRNVFSWTVWNRMGGKPMGLTAGTEAAAVEVFINDTYWGVYTLLYPVKEETLGLAEGESLFRCDRYVQITDELLREPAALSGAGFRAFWPDDPQQADWDSLAWYLGLYQAGDAEWNEAFRTRLDPDDLVDLCLFVQMAGAVDNTQKNLNWAVLADGRIALFPWDFDLTWGNVPDPTRLSFAAFREESAQQVPGFNDMTLNRFFYTDPQQTARIAARYRELRATVFSQDELLELLGDLSGKIYGSGAAVRSAQRWPDAARSGDASAFARWILTRLETMDAWIGALTGEAVP